MQVGCLKVIELLLDSSAGLSAIMNVANIKQFALLLESEDQGVQTAVMRLLAAVCLMPPKGYDLVEGTCFLNLTTLKLDMTLFIFSCAC